MLARLTQRLERLERLARLESAIGVADRIIRRFTSERHGWTANNEALKHLRLVVLAELLRAERERGRAESNGW